jgi:hypothetical protein
VVKSDGKELFCLGWRSITLAAPKLFVKTSDTCCNVCLALGQLFTVCHKLDVSVF